MKLNFDCQVEFNLNLNVRSTYITLIKRFKLIFLNLKNIEKHQKLMIWNSEGLLKDEVFSHPNIATRYTTPNENLKL